MVAMLRIPNLVDICGNVLIDGVSWAAYLQLLRRQRHRRLRVTFDRGSLEVMSLTFLHETTKERLSSMVRILACEYNIDYTSGGATTFRRRDLRLAFEPDQCFYFANWRRVAGKRRLELPRDPPPDLVIEIDLDERFIDRMPIFESVGVPEVWRYDGEQLEVFVLSNSQRYETTDRSKTFPNFPLSVIADAMKEVGKASDLKWDQSFRTKARMLIEGSTKT